MVDQAIIISVQNYLRKLTEQGLSINFAVIFGATYFFTECLTLLR